MNNFDKIIQGAKEIAQLDWAKEEISRLPSGEKGFIYLTVEDALGDLAGYMSFDGDNFRYDGPEIPDCMVIHD